MLGLPKGRYRSVEEHERESSKSEERPKREQRTPLGRQAGKERVTQKRDAAGKKQGGAELPASEHREDEAAARDKPGDTYKERFWIDVVVAPSPRLEPRRRSPLTIGVVAVQAGSKETCGDHDERRPDPEPDRKSSRGRSQELFLTPRGAD
jgi:hypothetical protein